MKHDRYLTTVVKCANRLEIEVPDLSIPQSGGYANGQAVELIVITDDRSTQQPDRQLSNTHNYKTNYYHDRTS